MYTEQFVRFKPINRPVQPFNIQLNTNMYRLEGEKAIFLLSDLFVKEKEYRY